MRQRLQLLRMAVLNGLFARRLRALERLLLLHVLARRGLLLLHLPLGQRLHLLLMLALERLDLLLMLLLLELLLLFGGRGPHRLMLRLRGRLLRLMLHLGSRCGGVLLGMRALERGHLLRVLLFEGLPPRLVLAADRL